VKETRTRKTAQESMSHMQVSSAGRLIQTFGSGTDLISLLMLLFVLCSSSWGNLFKIKSLRLRQFKSDQDEIWQQCYSSKNVSTDKSLIFEMTSYVQDDSHDISCRKVLPSGEYSQSV